MTSILAAQIDFLGEQMHSLAEDADVAQIEEAIAVSLSLFDQIASAADRSGSKIQANLFDHWLRSAEAILVPLRDIKSRGHRPRQLDEFMRPLLKARAVVMAGDCSLRKAGSRSLDEVERELDGCEYV